MHRDRFDQITRTLATTRTRRGLVQLGAALPLAAGLSTLLISAGETRRRKGKRQRRRGQVVVCHRGETLSVPREAVRGIRLDGGTVGTCSSPGGGTNDEIDSGDPCLPDSGALQAAIDAATPGATLVLCAGTWTAPSTFRIAKNLTLRGAGAGQTIFDGGRQQAGGGGVRVLEIAGGATVTVRDLTITNGNAFARGASNGGGIAVDANCTLTLMDSSVTNNVAMHDGGGIYIDTSGTLTLAGSNVTGNSAEFGGGIYNFFGTLDLEMSSSPDPFCHVTGNTATVNGGGILNWFATVTNDGTAIITNNTPNNCQPVSSVEFCNG